MHASFALRDAGFETVMVNCNPETVSTDYDISDRLYFEPVTYEDVLNIVENEKPDGVIVQFGGQTPLKLAVSLQKAGVPIIGTSPANIDRAEDRKLFAEMIQKLKLRQPENGIATNVEEAVIIAERIGYPILARPSYVLGGRAMEILYDTPSLRDYMAREHGDKGNGNKGTAVSSPAKTARNEGVRGAPAAPPILIDKFLDGAIEVDVDALADNEGNVAVVGILEHIEEAGIHSGDSAMSLPPRSLSPKILKDIQDWTIAMAKELKVIGLMNVQYAVKDEKLYVIEVNPRASRTVPFVSKTTGTPLAKIASLLMVGRKLKEFKIQSPLGLKHIAIKESVFPFTKFPGVDPILGPEMRSTGEVMGIAETFGEAFAKSQLGANTHLPKSGSVFLSVRNQDKKAVLPAAKKLVALGFKLIATKGTALFLREQDVPVEPVNKVAEGSPHIVDLLSEGKIAMVINTPEGRLSAMDSFPIRRTALMRGIPHFTTVAAALAAVDGIETLNRSGISVKAMQDYLSIESSAPKPAALSA